MAAQITAKIVIASLNRLILVRHFCRNRKRIADISVPAWPMPIQKTKLVMSNAQATGTLLPHTPTPVEMRYVAARTPPTSRLAVMRNAGHHQDGCGRSVMPPISSVRCSKSIGPHTSGMRGSGSANRPCNGSFAPAISCVSCGLAVWVIVGCGSLPIRSVFTTEITESTEQTQHREQAVIHSSLLLGFGLLCGLCGLCGEHSLLRKQLRVRVPHPRQVARPRLRVQLAQQQVLAGRLL